MGQLDATLELPAESLDQSRAEALPGGSMDLWTALLLPGELQDLIHDSADGNPAGGYRQRKIDDPGLLTVLVTDLG